MSAPNPARELAREVLARVAMETPIWRTLTGKGFVFATIIGAVAIYLVYVLAIAPTSERVDRVAQALLTIAAALGSALAYVQWHLGREEASFDRYYDRVRAANEHIDKAGQEAAKLRAAGHADSTLLDHHRNMIVFTELDTLEYVLGKRRLDFIDNDLVERAVRTFKGRCAEPWFVEKVRFWSERPELGYRPRTMTAARFLAGLAS